MNTNKLWLFLEETTQKYSHHTSFSYLEGSGAKKEISYGEFFKDLKNGILKAVREPYERVGIMAYNSYDWIISSLSLLLAGKFLILLDANLPDEDLLHLLAYTDTQTLIVSPELKDELSFVPSKIRMIPLWSSSELQVSSELWSSSEKSEAFRTAGISLEKEGSFMCFTSGTSKNSKGVEIPQEALLKYLYGSKNALPGRLPVTEGKRFFLPLPLHHIYGFTMVLNILQAGGTVCLGTGPRYLLREIGRLDPDVAFLVPSMLEFILKQNIEFSNLHTVITGGSYCRREISDLAQQKGFRYFNIYGSSETLGYIASSVPELDVKWIRPYGEIRFFVNDDGEIGVRLPAHMKGYYKMPDETAEVLKGDYFLTGDCGIMNSNGDVCIQGRIRDMIVFENGEKVNVQDKDDELTAIQGIKEAAVIRIPGLGMAAVVILECQKQLSEVQKRIDAYNRKRDSAARIRKVWFREEPLPKTTTGKLKRFQLEKEYTAEYLKKGTTDAAAEY